MLISEEREKPPKNLSEQRREPARNFHSLAFFYAHNVPHAQTAIPHGSLFFDLLCIKQFKPKAFVSF